ncbi:MAG: MFS transporter, partial [Desulfotignum sp.]
MNRNFRLLLSGQLVSQAGDKFHTIAVAFWILETTGSSGKMGMVLAASLLPSVLVGVFSGAVIDRYSKKMIIVGTDAIRGTVLLMAAWLMAEGSMGFTMILLLQAFLSVNAGFFDPSIPAVIP